MNWLKLPEPYVLGFSFRALSAPDKLGFVKYLFNLGKEYADLFRGSLTPTLIVGFVANQGGASLKLSALSALGVPISFMVIGIVAGFVIWRWRISHGTIEREWENNPFLRKQIDLLTEIRDELRKLNGWQPTEQRVLSEKVQDLVNMR